MEIFFHNQLNYSNNFTGKACLNISELKIMVASYKQSQFSIIKNTPPEIAKVCPASSSLRFKGKHSSSLPTNKRKDAAL